MKRNVKRYYEIDAEIFKQFSIACATLEITKKEGMNEALRLFSKLAMKKDK